jgi:hypothetical protein
MCFTEFPDACASFRSFLPSRQWAARLLCLVVKPEFTSTPQRISLQLPSTWRDDGADRPSTERSITGFKRKSTPGKHLSASLAAWITEHRFQC